MPVNSREKGKRGERMAAQWLRDNWQCDARRGQQFNGIDGQDVVSSIENLHIEVKFVESLNVQAALDQAYRDAGPKVAIVMHRRKRGPWCIYMRADESRRFIEIMQDHFEKMRGKTDENS